MTTNESDARRRADLLADIARHDWKKVCAINAVAAARILPKILTDLLSEDAAVRESAYLEATSVLWHQGTIYPVTADAVPLLVRMMLLDGLAADASASVAYVLMLVALAARGAAEGRSACGRLEDGVNILSVLRAMIGQCRTFLRRSGDMSARRSVLIAVAQVDGSLELVEDVADSEALVELARRLDGTSVEEAWDLAEDVSSADAEERGRGS